MYTNVIKLKTKKPTATLTLCLDVSNSLKFEQLKLCHTEIKLSPDIVQLMLQTMYNMHNNQFLPADSNVDRCQMQACENPVSRKWSTQICKQCQTILYFF